MIGVRRMTCEMHGCCFLANPVVANETTGAGLYTKEKECYQQPLTNYPEWFSLPFDSCSRDCHDGDSANVIDKNAPGAEVYPTRQRENICIYTNGSVASDILCGEPPVNAATCNMYEYCTETDADRAVAEIMVVASACIIHKLIRGSYRDLRLRCWDGPVLLAICAILHAS